MKTRRHLPLATLLVVSCLSSCGTIDHDPAIDRASFKIGDPFSRTLYEISGDRASKWSLTDNEQHKKREAKLRLSPAKVQAFWKAIDEAEVEKWLPVYLQTHFDGRSEYGDWTLNVVKSGKSFQSGGGQAFPSDSDPRNRTDLKYTQRFEKVEHAFELLVDRL